MPSKDDTELEKLTIPKRSPAPSLSRMRMAASRACTIFSPCIEPLRSRTMTMSRATRSSVSSAGASSSAK